MTRTCVIGWPIGHSRSPLIHNYWRAAHGIPGNYERVAVEPERLQTFLAEFRAAGFIGCNVTLPHKETAFAAVAAVDEVARRLGVVNTIYSRNGSLFGTSTDGEGFIAGLRSSAGEVNFTSQKALILGAGGSAMAIVGALLDEGMAEIVVANRSASRVRRLQDRFGPAVKAIDWQARSAPISEAFLIVNTTSLGMSGQPPLELDLSCLARGAIVADVVYVPLETAMLASARAYGNRVAGGLGMLLHQAVRGFELWHGVRPRVTPELYDLVARDIDPGYLAC